MAKKVSLLLLILILFTGCSKPLDTSIESSSKEMITLSFTILDQSTEKEEVLFDDEIQVSADCKTLADALSQAKEVHAVIKEGQYGITIVGLMGKESNWNKGPWWMYESTNNKSCIKMGYCEGASNLEIEDGDAFIFTLSMGY